jgi:hypothetical protein
VAAGFLKASSEGLTNASAPLTAAPMTMGCWMNVTNSEENTLIMEVHDASAADQSFQIIATIANAILWRARNSSSATATATGTFSDNTWHHVVGIEYNTSDRVAMLDGNNASTHNTTSKVPTGIDETNLGTRGGTNDDWFLNGYLAELGMWNIALSDGDVTQLALGVSPMMVRPDALVFYLPLVGLDYYDRVGGLTMTANGTPDKIAHPTGVIYPTQVATSMGAGAAAGGTSKFLPLLGVG